MSSLPALFVRAASPSSSTAAALLALGLATSVGCGGGEGREQVAETTTTEGAETTTPDRGEGETVADAAPDEAERQSPPAQRRPALPDRTASDTHTTVIGQIDGACSVVGVAGDAVYVSTAGSDSAAGSESTLVRFATDGHAEGQVVHRAPGAIDYRLAGDHVAYGALAEGFGATNLFVLDLDGSAPREVAHNVRQSSWALASDALYYADSSYSEPRVSRVALTGGEATEVEELRPVFDEDRIEQMVASADGQLAFVAVRIRNASRGGYFCHELRGGPPGSSQTLRRYRRCPNDDELLDALSVGPAYVYYHRAEGLYRVSRNGGREESIIADVRGVPAQTASDDRVIVWRQPEGILRLALGEPAVPELLAQPAQTIRGPVLAGPTMYWTRRDPGHTCVILSRPLHAPPLGRWEPT